MTFKATNHNPAWNDTEYTGQRHIESAILEPTLKNINQKYCKIWQDRKLIQYTDCNQYFIIPILHSVTYLSQSSLIPETPKDVRVEFIHCSDHCTAVPESSNEVNNKNKLVTKLLSTD